MTRLTVPLAAHLILALLGSPGLALEILTPSDGHRAPGGFAWLVVKSPSPLRVSLDGRALTPTRIDGEVYHIRLENLRPEGSRVEVAADEFAEELGVFGECDPSSSFHAQPPEPCRECHDQGESGCRTCHRWQGAKHAQVLSTGCVRCHTTPGRRGVDTDPVCAGCHTEYQGGKHPKLRHAVAAPRDPLRPGRKMGCVSCHDPHTPRCLGCLSRGELRDWCKRCHGRPL